MAALFCKKAPDRTAASWAEPLKPFTAVEFVVSDAGRGLSSAVAQLSRTRDRLESAKPLEHGLDVFHTCREASRVLGGFWHQAERRWREAEEADASAAKLRRKGINSRGRNRIISLAWQRAVAALDQAERHERAGQRLGAALEVFGPDGRLNDRARAQAEIDAVLPELCGPKWRKVRTLLKDRRCLKFLDRLHRRLSEAEPRVECREAMAWRWWGRHRRPAGAADPRIAVLQRVAWQRPLSGEEQDSYQRVAAVLGSTVRVSSAVECMNSVLRMQQSRHRQMTQPMLDLKRLYWNCHRFRSGPRKGRCPYAALGVKLPTFGFWELLHTDPQQLAQELSTSRNTP